MNNVPLLYFHQIYAARFEELAAHLQTADDCITFLYELNHADITIAQLSQTLLAISSKEIHKFRNEEIQKIDHMMAGLIAQRVEPSHIKDESSLVFKVTSLIKSLFSPPPVSQSVLKKISKAAKIHGLNRSAETCLLKMNPDFGYIAAIESEMEEPFIQKIRDSLSKPDLQILHLAIDINQKRMTLGQFLQFYSEQDLIRIAPYLTYVDFIEFPLHWNRQQITDFLSCCQNLQFLRIQSNEIETLPDIPGCLMLNCTGCYSLKKLPDLPCCLELYCDLCPSLTALPNLPACKVISCCECTFLTQLPELPSCIELFCNKSPSLKKLPKLPLCEVLSCTDCLYLRELPPLPQCEALNCKNSVSLKKIPELPVCRTIVCTNCPSLECLPPLPLCEAIDCIGCTSLKKLPFLRACRAVDCRDCLILHDLGTLPACQALTCTNCPALTELPDLPVCNYLFCEEFLKPEENCIKVMLEDLIQHPEQVLKKIAGKINNPSFPFVKFYEDQKTKLASIDQGGLSRHLQSQLFEHLFVDNPKDCKLPFETKDHEIFPYIRSLHFDEDIRSYLAIGHLLGHAYKNSLPTAHYFSSYLFDAITSLSLEKIDPIHDLTISFSDELFCNLFAILDPAYSLLAKVLNGSDLDKMEVEKLSYLLEISSSEPSDISPFLTDKNVPINAACLSRQILKLVGERPFEKVSAVIILAKGIAQIIGRENWAALSSGRGDDVRHRIEGELSHDLVLSSLKDWTPFALDEWLPKRTKDWLLRWIREAPFDTLKNFVHAVTGSYSLPSNAILKVVLLSQSEPGRIPVSHTCFNQLDLPSIYPNEEIFKEKMAEFLANAKRFDLA